jgi:hypothetical protein
MKYLEALIRKSQNGPVEECQKCQKGTFEAFGTFGTAPTPHIPENTGVNFAISSANLAADLEQQIERVTFRLNACRWYERSPLWRTLDEVTRQAGIEAISRLEKALSSLQGQRSSLHEET